MKSPKQIQNTPQNNGILHNLIFNNTNTKYASVTGEHLTIQIPMFQATANALHKKLTQKEQQ